MNSGNGYTNAPADGVAKAIKMQQSPLYSQKTRKRFK